ncbi:hypothetical protein [Sorangium sp. So ce854]|uniref:hypothetical protein n=1 Tax=Sorangium sp. So ce854 TaxID=3133322 RepID=UPI003F5EFAB5
MPERAQPSDKRVRVSPELPAEQRQREREGPVQVRPLWIFLEQAVIRMVRVEIEPAPPQLSMITWCRRILTKSRWTDPALSSSRAPAGTTSSARALSLINITPSS